MQWFWLFIAGGFGALARYALTGIVQMRAGEGFPVGTLAVNVAGCLAIGVLATLADERNVLPEAIRVPAIVGLLGGFTTFSAFGLETWRMLEAGAVAPALLNAVGSVGAGIAAVIGGVVLARALS